MSRVSASSVFRSLTSRTSASTRTPPSAAGASAAAVTSTQTGVLMLHRGSAYPTAERWPGGGKIGGANAEVAWQVTPDARLGFALMYWRDPLATRTRGQLWLQHALP